MDITVCIPWRPQPERMKAFDRIIDFWTHTGWPIVLADSDPNLPFSVPEARNTAVRKATTDHVIVADADTIPDLGAVHQALHNPGVTWPFTAYRHIPADYTHQSDLMDAQIDQAYRASVGGLFVTTQDTYWTLGGMDERFERRWGYEDNAFHAAAQTLSSVHRVKAIVFSFNHPVDRDLTSANPNRHRMELYKFATGKPDVMRELMKA